MAASENGAYVSIITSCEIGSSPEVMKKLWKHGEYHIDLYAFHEEDIALLKAACPPDTDPTTVVQLAAEMEPAAAAAIVRSWLPAALQPYCLPPQSPIRALATNFPEISDPDPAKRLRAQRAIIHCAGVAAALGAGCVEIVGGPSFIREANGEIRAGTEIYLQRQAHLLESLHVIDQELARLALRVGIALEIEPGPAYLLNSMARVGDLFTRFDEPRKHLAMATSHIGLNVDIGHMFILSDQDEDPMRALTALMPRIMHFHASDHTLSHFCDLEIPSFHSVEDFKLWVDLFVRVATQRQIRNPFFTGTIAIEVEAGHSIDPAIRSARLMRTWQEEALEGRQNNAVSSSFPPRMEPKVAIIVFVDIVSSTKLLMSIEPEELPARLSAFVRQMEQSIVDQGGFFDKFTGDGFMAVFSPADAQEDIETTVWRTLDFVSNIKGRLFSLLTSSGASPETGRSGYEGLRIGMSLGEVYFGAMNDGPRSQITAIGEPVVEAARLMAHCEQDEVLANAALRDQPRTKSFFVYHGRTELKGLSGKRRIYRFTGIQTRRRSP